MPSSAFRSRTLDGRTVPWDSLSGGAKEQLGIVARLAGSALVAKEDGVPVVIDDALGFSDADRLAKMAGGLRCRRRRRAGHRADLQIPERYAGVYATHSTSS